MLRRHDGKANQSNETKSAAPTNAVAKARSNAMSVSSRNSGRAATRTAVIATAATSGGIKRAAECGRRGSDRKLQEPDVDERDDLARTTFAARTGTTPNGADATVRTTASTTCPSACQRIQRVRPAAVSDELRK